MKERAAALFRRLAEAEAAVHGTSPEKVHFHEVGAVDSIVDIVGGVIALRWLGAARFVASPLNVGHGDGDDVARDVPGAAAGHGAARGGRAGLRGGRGRAAHAHRRAARDRATPRSTGRCRLLRIEKTGHGAGQPRHEGPAERAAPDRGRGGRGRRRPTRVLVLETEVDDASPQLLGPLLERLLARARSTPSSPRCR